jgi:metallo-beta-lactamase family protein
MAQLKFHGAAQQVTGSLHLLEANGKRIFLDCGMFQGRRAVSRTLNNSFPCDPSTVHALIVSHAHIDHTGRIPLLVQKGFHGVIHTTAATRDLSAVMLADSAKIQQEDARFLNKRRAPGDPEVEPLYDTDDVARAMSLVQSSPYGRWFKVCSGVHARYFDAGHMLGSAGMEIEITENSSKFILAFSGDVGRPGLPLLRDPAPLPPCDYLICESTYGGRRTEAVEESRGRLGSIVKRTINRGGRVLIPAFSVGRTQVILYDLRRLFLSGELRSIPVYVDSPLAIDATDVFRMHPDCYDSEAEELLNNHGGIFHGPEIHFVRTRDESKSVMRSGQPCIVIAASGMCEAGRILHHLRSGVDDNRNTILIAGFQAEYTLGRRIVERRQTVRILGDEVELRAEVAVLNGYSSHADAEELLQYAEPAKSRCRKMFLVHGELDQATVLAAKLHSSGHRDVVIPAMGDTFAITS